MATATTTAADVRAFADAELGLDGLLLIDGGQPCADAGCLVNKLLQHRRRRNCVHWQRFLLHAYVAQLASSRAVGRWQLKRHGDGAWYANAVTRGAVGADGAACGLWILEFWAEEDGPLHLGLLVHDPGRAAGWAIPFDAPGAHLLAEAVPALGRHVRARIGIARTAQSPYGTLLWLHVSLRDGTDLLQSMAQEPREDASALFEIHLVDALLTPGGQRRVWRHQVRPYLRWTRDVSRGLVWTRLPDAYGGGQQQ